MRADVSHRHRRVVAKFSTLLYYTTECGYWICRLGKYNSQEDERFFKSALRVLIHLQNRDSYQVRKPWNHCWRPGWMSRLYSPNTSYLLNTLWLKHKTIPSILVCCQNCHSSIDQCVRPHLEISVSHGGRHL